MNRESPPQIKKQQPRKPKIPPLPIEDYPLDKISAWVQPIHMPKYNKNYGSDHSDLEQNETLVIIKRTMKTFEWKKDEFYRDKNSKRNNLVNEYCKPTDPKLENFWNQRYSLFSKFDHGIMLDDESWYSVTPEAIAKNIAYRVNTAFNREPAIVMDAFGGTGGNVIQFARECGFAVGVEIDKSKSDMCANNCGIYKCQNKTKLIVKDYLNVT
jgi:tRNA/tmRNA/rRNA uracil-C5-methylase (TrmA/RlmC/RlmD family)